MTESHVTELSTEEKWKYLTRQLYRNITDNLFCRAMWRGPGCGLNPKYAQMYPPLKKQSLYTFDFAVELCSALAI
jgi:hypothetical protein